MFSSFALKLYALIIEGKIKSNADFWANFSSPIIFNTLDCNPAKYADYLNANEISLTCIFDETFPKINIQIKNSENPFLFAYRGNISLLSEPNNFAVVGTLDIDNDIISREKNIVRQLVAKKYNIISGLAVGCDTIAHHECIINAGKTIAILPSTIENIIPYQNHTLANQIVKSGGLILTEYILPSKDHYEQIRRYIDRDRLQALFSQNILLIASYRKNQGDSGSRHAMNKAKEYGINRYVMLEKGDENNLKFGLNNDLYINNDDIKLINEIHF